MRSAIGLSMATASPSPSPPGPLPSKRVPLKVGTKIGTSTASPVAVSPILRAEARTVSVLTRVPRVSKTRSLWEIWRPQWDSRRPSSPASRNRKLIAPATKPHHGTPPSRMDAGAV